LPRSRLELELTEGYLIEHKDRAKPILKALQAQGIRIALDDFGTGYSSIGYLREYRFDRLKIDRSLVRNMTTDDAAGSIIQATAVLARSMGMSITAEGVELDEEASVLRLAGCDSLQGFYFGRPQSAASITELLTSANAPTQQVAS
jgi:EAL domain-containing protein (putative c-di-GMP-specific phosphodiesterase class I)